MAPHRRSRCTVSVFTALAVVAGGAEAGRAQLPPTQLASLGAPAAPRAAAVVPEAVRVLIELRLGDLASVTVPAFRVRDEALIPLSSLLRLAEVRHETDADGTLEATLEPGSVRLLVAATRDTMEYGARRAALPRELKLFHDGELYVAARAFAEFVGLQVVVDWSELAVTILDPGALPVGRRVRREAARRGLLRRDETATGPVLSYPLERPRWDGLVLDYVVSAPGADPIRSGSFSLAAGMNAFGGSLETGVTGAGAAAGGALRPTASWTGVWAENPRLKQLRIGDGISTGPSPRLLRGVTVTNSPFLRPAHFAMNAFAGSLAPGWEVEAYQGGRLIAFDSTDALGRYAIVLPTQYGENPVDFVAYGPFGEVREFNRTYRVPGEFLPAGHLEYGASVGSCAAGNCTGAANADLRYGVSPRWTVRAGYDGFRRDTLPSLFHPYMGIAGSPTDAVGIHLEGVGRAHARALVRYEPSMSLRLAGEYTRFTPAGSAPVLAPPGWRTRWVFSGLVRPTGSRSSAYVEADAMRIETTTGVVTRARLTTSVQRWDTRIAAYLRIQRDEFAAGPALRRSFVGLNTFILPRTRWASVVGPAWVRTTLEVERSAGLSEASVAVTRPFARGVRVEFGGRWTRTSGAALTLLTALDLAAVRSYTTAVVPRAGTPTTGQYLQGSVVVNTRTREVTLAPGASVQRSGVAGRVFLDANANGLFDLGEPLLPSVALYVGAAAATSDSAGWFEVWNVPPLEPAFVTVDSLSLPSPLWIPAFATLTVVPGPNRFVHIDVPIIPGGVVEGRVLLETPAGRQPVGSVQLTLTEDRTGAQRTVTTFTDGGFTAVAIPPGSYQVTVDQPLLARLGAAVEVVRFDVPADPDGASVTGVEVILRRPPAEDDGTRR